ncbi:MAG: iron-containing alcohol dehydrogenase [Corallincola sp.]|nr:iron-containing alcohol dehydrogenase [Corallincola sp.]
MFDFDYQNPTRILFGRGKIADIDRHIPAQARVLVLYGGGSVIANGTLAEVRAALGGRVVEEFAGIEANPTYETLMRAVAQVKAGGLDYLLAVGGGSVIDGTKFVAAAACYQGDDAWQILEQGGGSVQAALPFASVLTLPATGSEMNCGSVITRQSTHSKLAFLSPLVYPQFSVLDPTKTFSLPVRQIANGVVDAFVHVMEQYLTYPVGSHVQDRLAEGLLHTLIDIGPQVLANPQDYDLRASLMWTATLALNGLIGAGVPQDWSTHMLGHELTALYDIDHARTLAIVLPSMMNERRDAKRAKLLQYAERIWNLRDGSEDERIDGAIARTRAFFESVGIATRLADYQVGADQVERLVQQLGKHGMTAIGEDGGVTLEVSRRVYAGAL